MSWWAYFKEQFINYANYLWYDITHPGWHSYFYWLVGISLLVWLLELTLPWRKNQKAFRKDFFLDGFYMFFNYFLFSLIGFSALADTVSLGFNYFLAQMGVENTVFHFIRSLPNVWQLLLFFVVVDFTHWNVHRMLHKIPFLWQFHKVHHSVKEMGFAAHLRFHWMESVVYRSVTYFPLLLIGASWENIFIVHMLVLFIGHLNHANLGWDYGPLKYLFNNPKMHIWHHAKELPPQHPNGVNYGLSLSLWDYIFGTSYLPKEGKNIELGFDGDEAFPQQFSEQVAYPFFREKED